MNVHLFGNGTQSRSRHLRTLQNGIRRRGGYGKEAKRFIHLNFYVDDGLASLANVQQAIELVKNAQASLATANLRLHKVVLHSVEVMEA